MTLQANRALFATSIRDRGGIAFVVHRNPSPAAPEPRAMSPASTESYVETRHHELRKTRMLMVDGNLVSNQRSVETGVSARVYDAGYWGFASAPSDGAAG